MPPSGLRQTQVDRARPRRKPYSIRVTEFRGFGVRVAPCGRKRFFLHVQHEGTRVWRDCGDATAVPVADARARAIAERAALRGDGGDGGERRNIRAVRSRRRGGIPALRASVEAAHVHRQSGLLPPANPAMVPGYSDRRHHRSGRPGVVRITPRQADRALPVLSVILRQAEIYGYRPEDSNPCRGIRRYRRRGRERFLGPEELRRLGAALDRHARRRPRAAAAIRLILLTGCRKGEILDLRWMDYREGKLFLRDSKTGPRTVWLSARAVLDALPHSARQIFSTSRRRLWLQHDWEIIRKVAGLDDVRLHDCRHTYASIAMLHGESIRVIGQLLGHRRPDTTLKYVHLADASARAAVESLADVLAGGA